MISNTKLPKKQLYSILAFCSIIIFSESLTVMIRVKDIDFFNDYLLNVDNGDLSSFIAINLSYYFSRLIIPIFLSIHSFIAYKSIRIGKLFVFIWFVLLLGGLAYTLLELNLNSIFYYINIIFYILLLFTILSLNRVIDENKAF